MVLHLTIKSRSPKPSKRFPLSITLNQSNPSVRDLKVAIEASKIHLNQHRQRITTIEKKQVLDDDDKSLETFGIKDNDELHIKDLGPQVGESLLPSRSRVRCRANTSPSLSYSVEDCRTSSPDYSAPNPLSFRWSRVISPANLSLVLLAHQFLTEYVSFPSKTLAYRATKAELDSSMRH